MQVQYPYPVKQVTIQKDIRIAYMDEGKGEKCILFLHGLANYAAAWRHQIAGLKDEFRCIAIDLPGNGYSSRGDYPYSMFFYAECIKQFTDSLNLKDPVLAGHSMGGQISIMLSLRYPTLFSKLVLLAPAGIEFFSETDKLIMKNLISLGDFLISDEFHLETTIRESFETPGSESQHIIQELKSILKEHPLKQWKDMGLASINGMLNEQVNKFLPQLEASTLLIFGEKDRLIPNRMLHPMDTPASTGKQGAALIPQSELHLIPHAGHFVHIEKHREVNEIMRTWMHS